MFPRRTICQIAQFLFLGKKMNQWRKKIPSRFSTSASNWKTFANFQGTFQFFPSLETHMGLLLPLLLLLACRCLTHGPSHPPLLKSLWFLSLSLPFSFSLSLSRSFHLSMQLISFSNNVLVFNHAVGNCFPVQLSAVCLADLRFFSVNHSVLFLLPSVCHHLLPCCL